MYRYVLEKYTKNHLVESNLSLFILSLPPNYIRISYATRLRVLSHLSCNTNPWTTSWVLETVPDHSTGDWDGGWTFIDLSYIPNHDQVDSHIMDTY